MAGRDLLSIQDFSKKDIDAVLALARRYEARGIPPHALKGNIIGSCFFEASTRTRLSFEAAAHRCGADVIGFADAAATSHAQKGENFEDTIRMIDGYVDCIVIRHPEVGAAQRAVAVATVPVINAGDGSHEHPSQTLIDLYAIQKTQGTLDGLTVALVGDLKYGRVPHSLAIALSLHPTTRQVWVAPSALLMPDDVRQQVHAAGVTVEETKSLADAIASADILLMTRVQEERFSSKKEYEQVKDVYVLQPEMLTKAKKNLRILHALPRRYEMPTSIDALPYAYYFQQARHAVAVRAALFVYLLQA